MKRLTLLVLALSVAVALSGCCLFSGGGEVKAAPLFESWSAIEVYHVPLVAQEQGKPLVLKEFRLAEFYKIKTILGIAAKEDPNYLAATSDQIKTAARTGVPAVGGSVPAIPLPTEGGGE